MTTETKIKFSSLMVDLEREAKGDWIDYTPWKGAAFHVNSLESPAFKTARDLKMQELTKKYPDGDVPQEVSDVANGKLYAGFILNNWRGFDEEYTPENGLDACVNPAKRNVLNAIAWCASRLSRVEAEFIEVETKNSGKPSATV